MTVKKGWSFFMRSPSVFRVFRFYALAKEEVPLDCRLLASGNKFCGIIILVNLCGLNSKGRYAAEECGLPRYALILRRSKRAEPKSYIILHLTLKEIGSPWSSSMANLKFQI